LYEPLKQKFNKKPSTQRQTAKKEYLKIAKKRKPNHKEIKKAIKKLLLYVSKNKTREEAANKEWC